MATPTTQPELKIISELKTQSESDLQPSSTLNGKISKNDLIPVLENHGKSRQVFAETTRLRLCSPTILDILLHNFESSTIAELAGNIFKEYDQKSLKEIEEIAVRYRTADAMQWLLSIPESPFGQVSFFLKDGRYIGRCRFYLPSGETVAHRRGTDSGGPQDLPFGFSEMSFHFLDAFTGKGYGSEGLKAAAEKLILPQIGAKPNVFAGVDSQSKKTVLQPTQHPFQGLATTTALVNIPSIKASLKAGFVPGKFPERGDSASSFGYFEFRYPTRTQETALLQKFLQDWLAVAELLGREYFDQPYMLDESGYCNYGFRPELFMHYHRLKRKHNLGKAIEDKTLLAYETRINEVFEKSYSDKIQQLWQLFCSGSLPSQSQTQQAQTQSQAQSQTQSQQQSQQQQGQSQTQQTTSIPTLVWQYFGKPMDIKDEIATLPPLKTSQTTNITLQK